MLLLLTLFKCVSRYFPLLNPLPMKHRFGQVTPKVTSGNG